MRKINFTKMVASGNDFIIIDRLPFAVNRVPELAKDICERKFGVGADGLLVLKKSKAADIRMRIFNADGSEAQMCGNGARCTALYLGKKKGAIETKAGIIKTETSKDNIRIKLTDPKNLKLGIPIKVSGRNLKVNFVDTGVSHCVIFVEGLEKVDVAGLGRQIRYHKQFSPRGTNVNFVEILSKDSIKIRTYERGVEGETLACGTGSTAAAIISSIKLHKTGNIKIGVLTQGKEVLKVYFKKQASLIQDVWLQGEARIVYRGEYYV
jgi:diaminopimelate epimerase